jgi:hypothetical protein
MTRRFLVMVTLVAASASFVLPCAPPLAALAAFVAGERRRRAYAAIAMAWALNQGLGFGIFGFPHTRESVALGIGLLVATVAASELARIVRVPAGIVGAFAAAALAFEGALALTNVMFGLSLEAFAPAIDALVIATNAAFFIAFAAACRFEAALT